MNPLLLTDLVPGKATLRTDVADYEREDAPPARGRPSARPSARPRPKIYRRTGRQPAPDRREERQARDRREGSPARAKRSAGAGCDRDTSGRGRAGATPRRPSGRVQGPGTTAHRTGYIARPPDRLRCHECAGGGTSTFSSLTDRGARQHLRRIKLPQSCTNGSKASEAATGSADRCGVQQCINPMRP